MWKLRAPAPAQRPDVTLEQRKSEALISNGSHYPLQRFLREQKTIAVTPTQVVAHRISAAPTILATDSAYVNGKYAIDYSELTQMGARSGMALSAPPDFLSVNGIQDVQIQVINNGIYSQMNANLSSMYTGLKAPSPWAEQQNCQ